MEQWVPFEEGEYLIKQAFLVTPDKTSVSVEKSFIEVYNGPGGLRQVKGSGLVRPFLMVELHEEHESIDMIIDLGGKFKYFMKNPVLQAGKVFAPDVSSSLQFYPSHPWDQISETGFDEILKELKFME